ncbi:septum formation family protein [Dactylosporangium sp. NPDC051485]|uniref:septum formation family protein n=1 Tax=Dactylosporangium sp. NPDC051485 TaxID=3154846 RepID=UPI003416D924
MRTKILIGGLAVAMVATVVLWWHETSGDSGLGCYVRESSPLAQFASVPAKTRSVGCDESHEFEAIGMLGLTDPEGLCRREAEEFLGGPWELSRTVLTTLGSHDPMNGTLMCALAEIADTDQKPVARSGSLRNGLRGTRPLAITCLAGDDDHARFIDCAQPHAAEFVGTVPRGEDDATETACASAAARYLGLPSLEQRTDLQVNWLNRDSTLCLAVEATTPGADGTLRGSLKGRGTQPLPR